MNKTGIIVIVGGIILLGISLAQIPGLKEEYKECYGLPITQRTACMEYKYGVKRIDYVELLQQK